MPLPEFLGSGSMVPTTTRATPALMIAFAQAGVLPLKLHGSRVTYRVDPLDLSPACSNAFISACFSPALR